MATSELTNLHDVFELVHLTPGQASKVLYSLASDLADSDPELRTAFLTAAEAVVAPPEPPPGTRSASTTRIGGKAE